MEFLILTLALWVGTHAIAKTVPTQKLTTDLDALLEQDIKDQKLVGAIVFVPYNGELAYSHAAGLEDREANKPMKITTSVRLASMTKAIVSAAAVRLFEEKKLKLDDPVSKYLPFFLPKAICARLRCGRCILAAY